MQKLGNNMLTGIIFFHNFIKYFFISIVYKSRGLF